MVGLFRKKCVFFFKKKVFSCSSFFLMPVLKENWLIHAASSGSLLISNIFTTEHISTNLSSQFRIFFRKCKQKSGNIHTQLQKMPNNIFFLQKIKARYIFSEFFEVPQIVLGSQKSKL